jgi:hypothetical protein
MVAKSCMVRHFANYMRMVVGGSGVAKPQISNANLHVLHSFLQHLQTDKQRNADSR